MLLDTNVLVRAFESDTDDSAETFFFLREADYQWLVPVAVIVESWGFLVGKQKNWRAGFDLLAWLNTPGSAIIISQRGEDSEKVAELMAAFSGGVDCVDAMLMLLATDITGQCNLTPPIPVATYDTRDFNRARSQTTLRVEVYDMRSDIQY